VLDAGCGSGRVTAQLCERLPGGSVIALDRSAAMLIEAKRRLAPFGERVGFVRADLARPLPLHPVDAVFSTATFHWIRDHDALFANLVGVSPNDLVSRSSTTSDSTSWRGGHGDGVGPSAGGTASDCSGRLVRAGPSVRDGAAMPSVCCGSNPAPPKWR